MEVTVALVVVVIAILLVLMMLPVARESSDLVRCQRKLQHLGQAFVLYDTVNTHLPTVPDLGREGASPQQALLTFVGVENLGTLDNLPKGFRPKRDEAKAAVVPDLICPSDRPGMRLAFPAPVSYRADAGSTPAGLDGPFAFGKRISLSDISRRDGTEYTVGLAERLIGTGAPAVDPRNYFVAPNPVTPDTADSPAQTETPYRGDAGSNWSRSGWVSALYNHAIQPNARRSCIAKDERTALMGASSAHGDFAQVLMLDGRVDKVRQSIAPRVWQSLATPGEPRSPEK